MRANMPTGPLIIALALLLLVAVAARLKLSDGRSKLLPYSRKNSLLSPAERSFLGVLEQAIGSHYRIYGKVRIADVVETKRGLNAGERQRAFNRIGAKHFDFLLCDRHDLSIVCAIELDDRSHRKSSRQKRDAFVVALCRAVGLPLLNLRASRAYSVPELRAKILETTQRRLEPSLSLAMPIEEP